MQFSSGGVRIGFFKIPVPPAGHFSTVALWDRPSALPTVMKSVLDR